MEIIFVSKKNCPFCEKAKGILNNLNKGKLFEIKEYCYTESEGAMTKEEVTALVKAPDVIKTLPQIALVNEGKYTYIGGCDNLEKHFGIYQNLKN